MPTDISRTSGAYIHRKKQAALVTFYKDNPIRWPLDNSTLLDLKQGRILCCCPYSPVTITGVTQNQTFNPVRITVIWNDDPNAISYDVAVQVVTGSIDPNNPPIFEIPSRTSVTGSLGPTVQTFKIGIVAIYPCGSVISWTDIQTMTGSAP